MGRLTPNTAAFWFFVSCLVCSFIISGVERGYSAEPNAAKAPADVAKEKEPAGGVYEYTGLDRRDPFTPLVSKREARGKGITPLESYDISEMKIIAILWDRNKHFAVISLPDGKSYNVSAGTKVGGHGGVINSITKDTVVITERIKDASGVMSPRNTVLRLRGEEEE
jgi:Tfp pilus assembly protein PilP